MADVFIPKKDGSGNYQKNEFIAENTGGKYPESCKFTLFNKPDVIGFVKVGNVVNVEYNFKTNEYNGKFYTEANAWRVAVISAEVVTESAKNPEFDNEVDDLPF